MPLSETLTEILQKRYIEKTPKSRELFFKNVKFTPQGVHSNWRIFVPHPIFMVRAKGSRIWDVDNNEYIDYNMAFGALGIGHAHPTLVEIIKERIENGTIYGFETDESVKLAKVLTQRFNFDMVRFSSTGLEATQLAIRLARAATKRKKILKFEGCYHGSHDTLMVGVKPDPYVAGHPKRPRSTLASWGMPEEIRDTIIIAPFNDLEATEKLMKIYGNEVAGIILEPIPMNMGVVLPDIEFLKGLRELADEYNSMLIFDEVKTGGKFYKGAQEYFGIKPDIMTIAKAIAGGYPFSAVLANRDVMELIGVKKVAHGGTFNSNPLSVTAALITLTKILTENSLNYAWKLNEILSKGYKDIIEDNKIEAHVVNIATSGVIYFTTHSIKNWRDFVKYNNLGRWYAWVLAMLIRGIIPQALGFDEQWTVSIQHSKEDIEKTLEIAKEAIKEIKEGKVIPVKPEEAL